MTYIKKYLFYLFIFSFISSIYAGPIYISKIKSPTQTICLLGDQHDTHQLFNGTDKFLANKFLSTLDSIKGESLLLLEDTVTDRVNSNIFAYIMTQFNSDAYNAFLPNINLITRHTAEFSNQHSNIQVKTIDKRKELCLFQNILELFTKIQKQKKHLIKAKRKVIGTILNEKNDLEKNINIFNILNKNLKTRGVVEILEQPINALNFLSKTTTNLQVKKIFKKIKKTLLKNKLLFEKALLEIGFLEEEKQTLSIDKIMEKLSSKNCSIENPKFLKYFKILNLLSPHSDIMLLYYSKIVEANALWHIADTSKKKIIVIAGYNHIKNLEKYLLSIGYKKTSSCGSKYVRATHKLDKIITWFLSYKINIGTNYNVKPKMFDVALQYQLLQKPSPKFPLMIRRKIAAASKVKLVQSKTFSWIL